MANVVSSGTSSEVFDPWLWDVKWADQTLSYSFPTDPADYTYTSFEGEPEYGEPLNPVEQAAVLDAFEMVSSFTALEFVNLGSDPSATIRFAHATLRPYSFGFYPAEGEWGGDVFFGQNFAGTAPVAGNFAFSVIIHELGHALGLLHGHDVV